MFSRLYNCVKTLKVCIQTYPACCDNPEVTYFWDNRQNCVESCLFLMAFWPAGNLFKGLQYMAGKKALFYSLEQICDS